MGMPAFMLVSDTQPQRNAGGPHLSDGRGVRKFEAIVVSALLQLVEVRAATVKGFSS